MRFEYPKLRHGKKYDKRYRLKVGRCLFSVYRYGWRLSFVVTITARPKVEVCYGCFYGYPHLHTGNTSEPPPHPQRPIGETVLKKGGIAENFIRPAPLNAKPGDIIVVTPLPKESA